MLLHVASTPIGAATTVVVIFLLIFALSFAFGPVPEGGRRFSAEWTRGWLKASVPRMIVAGVFAGIVLAAALSYGNSGTQAAINCDRAVPPLTGNAVTDARLLLAIDSLGQMADAADDGDAERARTIWLTSDAHNLSHDVDGPLRKQDPELARSLCENVVALENVMVGQIVTARVSADATAVAGMLQQARPVLRDAGSPTPAVQQPCQQPLGAVTTQPLTAERLQQAISGMRRVSTLAESGDQAAAEALFAGDSHNITHDIDGPLRTADEQLAIDLCLAIVEVETHLGANYDGDVVAAKTTEAADYLQEAARTLGILQ